MRRRRILLVLALAAVASAAGLVLFSPRGPKEPVVEGKRVTVWVTEAMMQPVSFLRENASRALKAKATNAVPYFLHQFTRPRSKWRATLNRWASTLPVVDFQIEGDDERIFIAAWGLHLLGPDAAPALPTLASYLDDPDRSHLAALAMAGVGERAVPWLHNASASTNPDVAQCALNGLVWMARESESESAIHALVDLLHHTDSATRMIAAVNLQRVVTRPDLTVPPLAAALSDPEQEVRLLAAHSLGEMGFIAQPALPALLRLMTSTNSSLASAASNAVFQIDPAALPARGP